MKIQIIGYSGSGKSSLAKRIQEKTGFPILYLDKVKYRSDWSIRPMDEQEKMVEEFLNSNPNDWIIDGNFRHLYLKRYEMCDECIFLKFGALSCYKMWRKRFKISRKEVVESSPGIEKGNFSFRMWILFGTRSKKRKKELIDLQNRCKGKKIILRSKKEVDQFVNNL